MASGKWVSTIAAIKFAGSDGSITAQYPASTFAVTRNSTGNYKLDLASDFQTAWGSPFAIFVTIQHSATVHARIDNVTASRVDVVVTDNSNSAVDPTAVHLRIDHFNGS